MEMQHIQEFQNFSSEQGSAPLLGYYGEGGHGSHPAILTTDELSQCGFIQSPGEMSKLFIYSEEAAKKVWSHQSDSMINFHILHQLPAVPDALCCWMEDANWNMIPVEFAKAQSLVQKEGGDTIYMDNPLFPQAVELAGVGADELEDVGAISFILNPKVNHVYWSNNPESNHGHWEDGKAIPLRDLADNEEI